MWRYLFLKFISMKTKFTLSLFAILFASFGLAMAQSEESEKSPAPRKFKPFQIEFALPVNLGVENGSGTGLGFYVAPRYAVNDQIHVGVRTGWFDLGESSIFIQGDQVEINGLNIVPVTLTFDYYFTTERVRPFVGIAGGMYRRSIVDFLYMDDKVEFSSQNVRVNPGISPQIGINANHFRFSVGYHITGESIPDFLSINIGLDIGGGRTNRYSSNRIIQVY